ncbi:hypothetical protein KYI09_09430 [Macrococcoides caseolyticum]|uniref:hypothetical protein n=2 Tax=Macrococcoides caseolyticum TaxID=69966 RepID=UPI001C5E7180|nr:hypothetical protein [Macrococcus caseolyticus]MDJ1110544.1 hypothetical protein [Macrococcus caseolyticus]QYA39775.1 hypothetical protein KYI09_09430 [Macrococcus caseolyticus]
MKKSKVISSTILASTIFFSSSSVFALENEVVIDNDESNVELVGNEENVTFNPEEVQTSSIVNKNQPQRAINMNSIVTYKKNVTTSYSWSSYRRVSDDMKVGSKGGSISVTKQTTFGTTVTGSIKDLGISANITKSSSIGYKLNLDPNTTRYVGYRAYYKIEKGTRVVKDQLTGKIISTNSYTVKTPTKGAYSLLKP